MFSQELPMLIHLDQCLPLQKIVSIKSINGLTLVSQLKELLDSDCHNKPDQIHSNILIYMGGSTQNFFPIKSTFFAMLKIFIEF
jgi:hypothetical protein